MQEESCRAGISGRKQMLVCRITENHLGSSIVSRDNEQIRELELSSGRGKGAIGSADRRPEKLGGVNCSSSQTNQSPPH